MIPHPKDDSLPAVDARRLTPRSAADPHEELARSLSLLQATLESTADGILVVDREGRIVSYNSRLLRMWHLPASAVGPGLAAHEVPGVLEQLEDPDGCVERIREIMSRPDAESFDLVALRDGRLFERTSQPQRIGGEAVGRVWSYRDVTEREKAEAALRESEKKYRDLFSFAPIGIYQATRDGRLLTANAALAKLLGYASVEELLRRPATQDLYFRPEDGETVVEQSGPVGHGLKTDVRFRRKDGSAVWVQLFTHTVRDPEGKTLYREGFVSDLTERKKAEALQEARFAVTRAIAESWSPQEAGRQILRALCENLGWELGVFWSRDPADPLLGFTSSWRPPGLRPSELEAACRTLTAAPGQSFPGAVLATGKPAWIEDLSNDDRFSRWPAAHRDGLGHGCVFPIVSEGKGIGVVELFASDKRAPDVPLLRVLGDLGSQIGQFLKRQQADRARTALEERYRHLFERNLAGVYRSTRDGRLLDCNDAFARIFGYASREEILGRNTVELYPDPESREAFVRRLHAERALMSVETLCRRKDGSPLWILENVSCGPGEGVEAGVFEGTVIDITDRKLLEEQLRQSQKMEAIGRLAGGIAHDFNNLLTAILGFSSLVLSQLDRADPLHQNVAEIRRAGERAATLTRQLLAFSRRQILAPVVLDINAAVNSMEKMLRRLIGDDVVVTTLLDPELGRVKADPGQIEQVIVNLVVNSRDAMPDGGRLTIETRNVMLDESYAREHVSVVPGAYVMLAVSDTGIGMDAVTQAHIFEPFYTTKARGRGTGLGLPTVYGIVKQSGGYIWVYSEPGLGAMFRIYLPRVEAPEEDPRAVVPRPESFRGSETVLVVENEDAVRRFILESLQRSGYTVLEASHGAEALEVAERHKGSIELLVTDVVMPVLGGRDLARRIVWSRPEIQVLYVSGFTDGAIARDGVLPEETAFLPKPFTQDELVRRVRHLLDGV